MLWGLPASFGGHPSGQLSSAQLLPGCLSGRKSLWLSGEERHFLARACCGRCALLVADGEPSWSGCLCRVLFTGTPQPPSVSCRRGGVSGQEEDSTFLEGLLSVRLLWIQGRGILSALPSVARFCQEMLGLDCLLPLGGRK